MALFSLRVRRALSSLSTAHRSLCAVPAVSSAPAPAPGSLLGSSPSWRALSPAMVQSRLFRSSAINLLSNQSRFNSDDLDKIDPDTILFEGCDYNHWLITMDFPKDPRPSPEEMVRTYEETCAKGLKISLEEAKQRMYACSTTTYQGFQAVMTEAESEQFRGLPGVVFILPDSYIDPQNKEYGGDKYENGMITPRPPPIQYGRQVRNRDRNRNFDQPRYERQGVGPVPNRQGNPQFDSQGQMQRDGRNYGPPQNYPPQQNYGPQGQSETRNPMPVNNYGPPGRDSYQADRREPPPSYQGNYNQMGQNNNYYNQERRDMPRGDGRNYAPPVQNDFVGNNRSYPPPQGGSFGQSPHGYQGQGAGGTYGQGTGSYEQGTGGTYGQGAGPYGPGTGGKYGQGTGGTHGQGTGSYGQGTSSYGMGYTQAEERNMQQGDQKEHGTGGQMGTDQRRY